MDGLILINKEKQMTSHDVVNIARKALHTKKVGHCGTLDPDATGVLVLCINKATKALQFLQSDDKEYICTLSLGTATDTYDATGTVIDEKPFSGIHDLNETLNKFIGVQKQLPPMYSAIKVNGKKLYEYARENKTVEIEERIIEIKELECLNVSKNIIQLRVACSKGTYIRSLCYDIAKALGYPGHMSSLIRTRSGHFTIDHCNTIEELKQGDVHVISIDDAFDHFPTLIIEDENIVYHGKKIPSSLKGEVVIKNKDLHVLAVYKQDGTGNLKCVRGLF